MQGRGVAPVEPAQMFGRGPQRNASDIGLAIDAVEIAAGAFPPTGPS